MAKKVAFAKNLALVGVISGVLIAIAVPFLAFTAAASEVIPAGGAIAVAIIAVLAGAPIVLVSAFFGIVIPSSVEKSDDVQGKSVTIRGKKGEEVRINGSTVSVKEGQIEETGGKEPETT